jgi:hypothetical protein
MAHQLRLRAGIDQAVQLTAGSGLIGVFEAHATATPLLGAAIVAREMFQGTEVIFVSASHHLIEAAKAEGFHVLDPVKKEVAVARPGADKPLPNRDADCHALIEEFAQS